MQRQIDRDIINTIPKDKLADFVFMHLRDMWAVDDLYFMGIEKKFGTKEATRIDQFVWEVMGKIEARKIKLLFDINGSDIRSMIKALQYSGWALDLEDKEIDIQKDKVILRNVKCRVQHTRLEKGLGEFGCKPVRWGFLKAFAKEFNPNIDVKCNSCPPDEHPDDLWCEWEFFMKEE
ncbi:MAG: DUF6125 family protein [Thermoplasmatota archaeon]